MLYSQDTVYPGHVRPDFIGDFLTREHVLAGGIKLDATQFNSNAVTVTVGAAGAAVDATTVPVAALGDAIPSGTVLDFGGKKFARLTANAAKNATSVTVAALATALVSGDAATYVSPSKSKRVQAGTLVGATNAELEGAAAAGFKWGPAADSDDVVYIVAYDVANVDENNDAEVLRKGTLIKVNNLPNWSSLSNTLKGKVRAAYECTVGAPGQEQ